VGKRQTVETLINEEALLLAKFLRDERKTWIPRIVYRYGEQDGMIKEFLEFGEQIKDIVRGNSLE